MSDSAPLGRALLRRWPLVAVLVLVSSAGGAGFAATRPALHTSQVLLAVGGTDLSAQAVPGFAAASKELASNYARFVTPSLVIDAMPAGQISKVTALDASPVPESNVIRIEAVATDEGAASAAASKAATSLVAQVTKMISDQSADKTLAAFTALTRQISSARQRQSAAQQRVDDLVAKAARARRSAKTPSSALTGARKALVDATATVSELQLRQDALGGLYQQELSRGPSQNGLTVVSPVGVVGDDASSRMQAYGLVGAAWGLMVSLLMVWLLDRRSTRRAHVGHDEGLADDGSYVAPGTDWQPAQERVVDVRRGRRRGAVGVVDSDAAREPVVEFPMHPQGRAVGDDATYDFWPRQR